MHSMSEGEWRSFVSSGTRTGKLAVASKSGAPHVTPVWFPLDGDEVVFTTWGESVKCKSLQRNPVFALCVDDQEPLYSYVMLECMARFVDSPSEVHTWATRLGARYMGAAAAESYGARNSGPGEFLVCGRITRVLTFADVAA
jgi:PPOX class probable F420-dependent enzyme